MMIASGSVLGAGATERLVDELFEVFDDSNEGLVDFSELMSGLSILCGGNRDDKARAAFALFDTSENGFISKDEMATYLKSVFKIIFATKPELYDTTGVGPEEFALATATQAFGGAEIGQDDLISFQEFQRYSTPFFATFSLFQCRDIFHLIGGIRLEMGARCQ
jgi:Ca2+-binding EF-hand superfamily protein